MRLVESPVSFSGSAIVPDPASLVDEGLHRFRVHTKAYTDEAVFRLEQERIFKRTWLFLGHTSEIPNARDFKTASMGAQPVIISRDDNGDIHVLVNRCLHRGAVLCREQYGNVRSFVCPYHSWSYAHDGRLTGIPDRAGPGGYSENFDQPEGLFRVPRVEVYRGFIFAKMFNPDVPPLVDFLGRTKRFIDTRLAQSPDGDIILRSKPYITHFKGNWKFQAENIMDNYHFMYVHKGFVELQKKYGDSTGDFGAHRGGSTAEIRRLRSIGESWGCRYGHGVSMSVDPGFEDDLTGPYADYFQALIDKHGEDEARLIVGKGACEVFPTLGMIFNQIRVWRPLAPDLTEVVIYPYTMKGVPDSYNEGKLRSHERFYSPSGYGATDDVEMFTLTQQGMMGDALEWVILERGLDTEIPDGSGDRQGHSTDEALIRAFWREWRRLMGAA